jgi:FixJ family two-component response regulator
MFHGEHAMATTSTVFVVDDDPDVRQSLTWLLESVGIQVQACESADAFLNDFNPARPGCLVLDVRMPGRSGLELLDELRRRGEVLPVIFLTAYGEVPSAVRAMKAGAVDFIEKPYSEQVLLDRIHHALEADRRRRELEAHREQIVERFNALSQRERQVMRMVVAGQPNRGIAAELGLSEKTIEVHRAHVMEKTQARSLPDLVRMVLVVDHQASADALGIL